MSLRGVFNAQGAFPEVENIINVMQKQANYLIFYKKFDTLTRTRFEALFDAVCRFCDYHYARQEGWPLKEGLEDVYRGCVV